MVGFWLSLQAYLKHFVDRLNMGYETKTGSKCHSKIFGLSISNREITIIKVGSAADSIEDTIGHPSVCTE